MALSTLAYMVAAASVTEAAIPTKTLPGGVKLPLLYMGSGNFTEWLQIVGPGGGIKTAWEYGNHSQLSMMPQVRAAGLKREEVFLETMIPCGGVDGSVEPMTTEVAENYLAQDFELLGTDYVDHLAIHHRCKTPEESAAVWKVLEAAYKRGAARAIGVSNFDAHDLAALMKVATVPIMTNEAHFAVGSMDYETIDYCNKHNISMISFSSLAAGVSMNHPTLQKIATKHNVSTVQVMYRFVSMHGIAVLSSFHKREHAIEDIAIFDLKLDDSDMADIKGLQVEKRTCTDCFTAECQVCAQKLIGVGCPVNRMPAWGRDNADSLKCMDCASKQKAAITEACTDEHIPDILRKACGTDGGEFPSDRFSASLMV